MNETEEVVDRVAKTLRADRVQMPDEFDARVMMRVRGESAARHERGVWRWMTRRRTVSVSPLGALALAAGLATIVALAARRGDIDSRPAVAIVPVAESAERAEQMTKFVFVSPSASSVSIVGDFNDWEEGGSPLNRLDEGVWTITIPLAPGRYQYTFVVDGTTWVADPLAPRSQEDDFGRPNSVVTVGDTRT